ncbi:hypothetical protein, partial [Saccharopolyspora rosea]
ASTTDDDLALNTDQDPNETRSKALVERHDRRDEQNPVARTDQTHGQAGRHSRDLLDAPTERIPRIVPDSEMPTDRILSEPLRWLETPADELFTLIDTQPMPQFPTTDRDGTDNEEQAERMRAWDVAMVRTTSHIDPRDPDHLALLLNKLRRWTPNPTNPQEPKDQSPVHTSEKYDAKPSIRFAALLLIIALTLALASLLLSGTADAPTTRRDQIRSAVMTTQEVVRR